MARAKSTLLQGTLDLIVLQLRAPAQPNMRTSNAGSDRFGRCSTLPGVAAAIVSNDSIVWRTTLGEADVAQHTPVTLTTRFPIASITKTMTAVMLMQLVGENRLSLDTPMVVSNPESALPRSVRVAHVLSHTSELGPGEEYLYNGSRFNTLTAVVERATGEPFARCDETSRIRARGHASSRGGDDGARSGYGEPRAAATPRASSTATSPGRSLRKRFSPRSRARQTRRT